MTERIVYAFPLSNQRHLRLVAVDVTNPEIVAQAPYQLVHSTLLFQRIPFADLNIDQLKDLHDAIGRELERHQS